MNKTGAAVDDSYELVIVGAGLTALSALRAGLAAGPTAVVEYRDAPGGFLAPALPAEGFAAEWDLVRSFEPPRDVHLMLNTTAVGLLPASDPREPHTLLIRRRQGTEQLRARAVLIACGGLEATRESAQVPGTRPAGVMTPALAHGLLDRGYLPGRRAIVYGASRYAVATARRLAAAGAAVTLVPPFGEAPPAATDGLAVTASAELVEIGGSPRLERVTLRRDGAVSEMPADMLIYAAGMVANTHWLKGSGVALDAGGAVLVDAAYRTNVPRVYAAGAVVAPSLDHARSIAMGGEAASVLAGVAP